MLLIPRCQTGVTYRKVWVIGATFCTHFLPKSRQASFVGLEAWTCRLNLGHRLRRFLEKVMSGESCLQCVLKTVYELVSWFSSKEPCSQKRDKAGQETHVVCLFFCLFLFLFFFLIQADLD